MKRYEKLALLVIALLILSRVAWFGRDMLLAQTYGPNLPPDVKVNWQFISFLISSALNVGVGIWLYIEAGKEKLNRLVWPLFGLFTGLLGLAIFYLIQIYTQLRDQRSAPRT